MATVYLAADLKHDRKVAIKVLKPELSAVLGADRFVQEIKTTAALSHPHILPLFDSGNADGMLFYVMPYIEGETIRDKLNRETQFGIDEAVKITTEVADALDYAHRHGVIHRDIKPENILLHDGRPMVMDFGIALAVSAAAGGRMTETGLSLGTPHYMSPEQATAEKDITARSDIYSLASVLYEMLGGTPPHSGGSAQQIIMRIITDTARPVTELRKSVPPHVAAAIVKALEKVPADRFESAKTFAAALANPAFTSATTAMRADARPQRTNLVLFAAATVVVALAAWFLGRTTAPGPDIIDIGLPDTAQFAFADEGPFAMEAPSLAVSPAGDFIVYVARRGSYTELWYRSLRGPEARPLPGTQGASIPALSPDGRWVAFESGGLLKKVLVDGSSAASNVGEVANPYGIAWNNNDETIVADGFSSRSVRFRMSDGARVDSGGSCGRFSPVPGTNDLICIGGGVLVTVARADRGLPPVTSSARPLGDSARPVLSDHGMVLGNQLVFVDANGNLDAAPYDARTRRVGPQRIVQRGMRRSLFDISSHFGVTRDGDLVFVPGSVGNVGEFVAADVDGRVRPLPLPPKQYVNFAMSPDGRRIAATNQGVSGTELWTYDVASGQGERLLVTRSWLIPPVWAPDGSIVFSQSPGWYDTLTYTMVMRPGSDNVTRLVDMPFAITSLASPTTLVGTTGTAATPDIMIVTLGGTRVRADTLRIPISQETPTSVSPDRQWLAYTSTQRGLSQVFVTPFPGMTRQYKVSTGVGAEPLWLPDGSLVYRVGHCWERMPRRTGATPPLGPPARAFCDERLLNTPGLSNIVTPDGRILYLRTMAPTTAGYVRIVRHWRQRVLEGTAPQ